MIARGIGNRSRDATQLPGLCLGMPFCAVLAWFRAKQAFNSVKSVKRIVYEFQFNGTVTCIMHS